MIRNEEKPGIEGGKMVPVETSSRFLGTERILLPEDAVSFVMRIFTVS